jgi:hypothetical protein
MVVPVAKTRMTGEDIKLLQGLLHEGYNSMTRHQAPRTIRRVWVAHENICSRMPIAHLYSDEALLQDVCYRATMFTQMPVLR